MTSTISLANAVASGRVFGNAPRPYASIVTMPPYAKFLSESRANTKLPRAFVARYKACARAWRNLSTAERAGVYARANKTMMYRAPRRFIKTGVRFHSRPFAVFCGKRLRGVSTNDLAKRVKLLAKEWKAQKSKRNAKA